jgi:antitoxin HigA-1
MVQSLRNPNRCPIHPGAILREDVLPFLKISPAQFAIHLGVSKSVITGILSEKKPLTVDLAIRISKSIGGSADSWLNMQVAKDLWEAEEYFKKNPEDIPKSILKNS